MKQLKENFSGNELSEYLNLQMVDEGVVGDFFKKTYSYLKGKIAKVGKIFVSALNLIGDRLITHDRTCDKLREK